MGRRGPARRRQPSEPARDGVYGFAYMFAPLEFNGATGSPRNPIAIR
jgi:hypothetical protein